MLFWRQSALGAKASTALWHLSKIMARWQVFTGRNTLSKPLSLTSPIHKNPHKKSPTTNHQDHTFSTTTQVSSPNKPQNQSLKQPSTEQPGDAAPRVFKAQHKLLQLLFHVITKYRAHQYKLPHFQSRVFIVISPGWQKRPALTLPGEISSFFSPPNLTKSTSTHEGKSKKM